MKNLKQIALLVLTSLMAVGCSSSSSGEKSNDSPIVEDKYIIQNGFSEYRIVLPSTTQYYLESAANELSTFLKEASGCSLPVINDADVKTGYNYISLGGTSQFMNLYGEAALEPIKGTNSGYFISTDDNDNIYICSDIYGYASGTLYGVYDLLKDMIGYQYYFDGEINYIRSENVHLCKYDKKIVTPYFDTRSIGTRELTYNDQIIQRLRLLNMYKGNEMCSNLYGHGQISKFMNPLVDKDENGVLLGQSHPDWFMNAGAGVVNNQLCYSAGEDAIRYVADKMISYLKRYSNAEYFMFGQEDNVRMCSCERCKKAMEEWAGTYGGLQVAYINEVIKICDEWLAENQPTRIVKYIIYAYYTTKYAPVKEVNGKWQALNERVVPNEKLCIFYAPIECNFAFPIDSPVNSELYLVLQQWGAITNNVIMYLYDVNFRNYFVQFNNFGTVKGMYETCHDNGVSFMYTQGAMDTATSCFAEMRAYVESSLMWNIDQNYDVLAHDFINHYYKDGAEDIFDYYQMIRDAYAGYIGENANNGSIYGNILDSSLWTASLVRKMDEKIHHALSLIDKYAVSDISMYNKLKDRIMREYLSLIYIKVLLYRSYYTDEQIEEMRNIFEYYTTLNGITASAEGGNLNGIF